MLYYSGMRLYKGRNNPIGRIGFRRILFNGRKQKSPEILLPPFISISELRLMLNLDYISCFRNAKISVSKNLYKWLDSYGRTFQTNNKRNIIISYDISSYLSKLMGYKPIKIDPEPKIPQKFKNHIPIISIVGHKNHGKTTLIKHFTNVENNDYIIKSYNIIEDNLRYIILDTPGDMNYDIIRGRAIYNSDVCIIVISSEGPEIITRNVILQADKFKIPIIFCITKTDLYYNIEILKSELQLQCEILYQSGHISHNYINEINNLILSNNLKKFLNKFITNINTNFNTPEENLSNEFAAKGANNTAEENLSNEFAAKGANNTAEENLSNEFAAKGANNTEEKFFNEIASVTNSGESTNNSSKDGEDTVSKGTNGVDTVSKDSDYGKDSKYGDYGVGGLDTVTEKYKKYIRRSNSLIKSGNGIKGIGNILEITKTESKGIIINLIVKFGLIVEGNYFIVGTTYGKINSIYNNTNEKMNMVGVGELVSITGLKSLDGVGIDDTLLIMSQHDAFRLCQYRKQLEILKSSQIQGPPIHSFNIQTDEIGIVDPIDRQLGIDYISKYSGSPLGIDPIDPIDGRLVIDGRLGIDGIDGRLGIDGIDGRLVTVTEDEINKFEDKESTIYLKPLENNTKVLTGDHIEYNGTPVTVTGPTDSTGPDSTLTHTNTNTTSTTNITNKDTNSSTTKGANSTNGPTVIKGPLGTRFESYSSNPTTTTTKDSGTIVTKVGVSGSTGVGGTGASVGGTRQRNGRIIIPIILRVNYMSILEIILDGIEEIEKEYDVRIPLIHGGIGPIIPIDIVQAQIGNKFTYCPVYSFQVPIHNDAIKHAIINKIVIKSFNIQSDLFNDIIQRCQFTLQKYNNPI